MGTSKSIGRLLSFPSISYFGKKPTKTRPGCLCVTIFARCWVDLLKDARVQISVPNVPPRMFAPRPSPPLHRAPSPPLYALGLRLKPDRQNLTPSRASPAPASSAPCRPSTRTDCRRRDWPSPAASRAEAEPTCGSQHHVVERRQPSGTCGSFVEHVEAGGEDRAVAQRLDQRRLVDQRAARDVDQHAVRPQRREHLGIDDCARRRRRRARRPRGCRRPSPSPISEG